MISLRRLLCVAEFVALFDQQPHYVAAIDVQGGGKKLCQGRVGILSFGVYEREQFRLVSIFRRGFRAVRDP